MRTYALIFVVAVSACSSDAAARLEDARARWRHAAIADYMFDYRTGGFAPPVAATITVRAGAVTDVQDSGNTGFPLGVAYAPTIETLFGRVESELDAGADVTVTWDAELGFPAHAYFDGGEEGDDFTVSEFRTGS